MRCPKCGKVLAKTNNGSYICSPDCKYIFDPCKKVENSNELNNMIDEFVHKYGSIFQDVVKNSMQNDIQKIVDEAKKEVMESPNQNYTNDHEDYESENKASTNDWIFESTNGFSRGW